MGVTFKVNRTGRPLLYETPEELQNAVELYFKTEERPTLSGLAVELGCDRKTLYNYKDRDEFFHIIKAATSTVETIYEQRSIYEPNPTGVIFALKNMGWKDRIDDDGNVGAYEVFKQWLNFVKSGSPQPETD